MIDNKIEYITTSAVWYKELKSKIPILNDIYLPKNLNQGIVFCGFRHHQCIYTACAMTGLKQHESGENIQGFLTSLNRFVDRKEAAGIAFKARQIKEKKDKLFSEDIY